MDNGTHTAGVRRRWRAKGLKNQPGVLGRHCPLHYRDSPVALAVCRPITAETLYIVSGLYCNTQALNAIYDLVAPGPWWTYSRHVQL